MFGEPEPLRTSMKRNAAHKRGPMTATEGDEALDAALDALADPDCRAILGAADTPMTTGELAEACDLALSTAYRKVERLSETPLLVEGVRFDPDGDHAAEYARGVTDARIELGDGDATLTVEESAAPESSLKAVGSLGVSAD